MTKKMILVVGTVLVFALTLSGCAGSNQLEPGGGLKVNSWSSALGSVSDTNLDTTRFTYFINLTNDSQAPVVVKTMEPQPVEAIKDKLMGKSLVVVVNKEVKPQETIELKAEILVNTKGMTKPEISGLAPFITEIKVTSDQNIKLNE
ncbi:MAG TPA: hypothetical protein VHS59_04605 [Bacillota bacterium]|nr:hypothetical protein [Bacillota bacterium]